MYEFLHPEPPVDRVLLRAAAVDHVLSMRMARDCAAGDRKALRGLFAGFWLYVEGFEKAIDRQVARLPIKPLAARYGQQRIRSFFAQAKQAVAEMKMEEGSHAVLWKTCAEEAGITLDFPEVPAVRSLLDSANNPDPVLFFCWLAGTEYIAEELARFLCDAPGFLACFPDRRWKWGDVHRAEHEGPSHLEIDEDLARAYAGDGSKERLERAIYYCQRSFLLATDAVYATL